MKNHIAEFPDQGSLVPVETGPGYTAWRATERDAPGLFVLVSDGHGTAIPLNPETDDLTIALFDEGVEEALGSIKIDGPGGPEPLVLQKRWPRAR